MVQSMAAGSVIVDVAVDQGGCVATTRPTTHEAPTYVEAGVLHYAVTNMPALAPRTASRALTNATLPYVEALAVRGSAAALEADPTLAHGLTIWDDRITCAPPTRRLAQSAGRQELRNGELKWTRTMIP
jgi:alanine dehydrogenase